MEKGKEIALKVGGQGKSLDWTQTGRTLAGCQCRDPGLCLLRRIRVHHINWAIQGAKVLFWECVNGWGQKMRLDQGS